MVSYLDRNIAELQKDPSVVGNKLNALDIKKPQRLRNLYIPSSYQYFVLMNSQRGEDVKLRSDKFNLLQ